jgi:hypothetical protein
VAGLTIMANMTIPFMAAPHDDYGLPILVADNPPVYGFNLILMSNGLVAALDGPAALYVTSLQSQLETGLEYYLTVPVRGIPG